MSTNQIQIILAWLQAYADNTHHISSLHELQLTYPNISLQLLSLISQQSQKWTDFNTNPSQNPTPSA